MTKITFVDENDNVIGAGTRKEALEKGIIRRIVQIFLFNSKGELLIQKRSSNVLGPGKWDESAGGQVDEGEDYHQAAQRELGEELGIKNIPLKGIAKFYAEEISEAAINKRFSMIYRANYDGEINFNKEEISEVRWITLEKLENWMRERPEDFLQGFVKALNVYREGT
ncbi:MAG: NUDIX domain-containing protein [Candidatus Colwellbacteria bacterium]